jgi:hypothetical protein
MLRYCLCGRNAGLEVVSKTGQLRFKSILNFELNERGEHATVYGHPAGSPLQAYMWLVAGPVCFAIPRCICCGSYIACKLLLD